MITKDKLLYNILPIFIDKIKHIYGKTLDRVFLFGSYARGDYNEHSDVDIMLLIDLPDNQIYQLDNALCEVTSDMRVEYDVDIQPMTINTQFFENKKVKSSLYYNIYKEGINLYAK